MRYSASEKLEIIRLVEQSHLPVRRTLGPQDFLGWLRQFAPIQRICRSRHFVRCRSWRGRRLRTDWRVIASSNGREKMAILTARASAKRAP